MNFLHGDLESLRTEDHHAATGGIHPKGEGEPGMAVDKESLRTEASAPTMVPKVRMLHGRPRVPQDTGLPLCIHEEV